MDNLAGRSASYLFISCIILTAMLYLPITPSWILSRRAQRLYLLCSIAIVALLMFLSGSPYWSEVWSVSRFGALSPVIMYPPGLCIIGTATLWVALWYFWFTFDRSQWWKRALWCFVLLLGWPLGPPLYYGFGYRRNSALPGQA